MEKKDSIFSGLNPSAGHAPAPAPAPRPSISEQEVQALKNKIEALEKNISTLSSPPPPPPKNLQPAPMSADAGAQFLLSKIGDLEKKIEDFSRNAILSAGQMKNIEESKMSARREIEDLLKAVREQQKYSELDRQMHEQLEKSWRRVEELEKKLMDFYSTAMAKSTSENTVQLPALAGEVEKVLGSVKSISERMDGYSPALARKTEERIASMSAGLDARLSAFETEFRKLHINIGSAEESMQLLYSDIKNELLSVLKNAIRDENGAVRECVDGFILDAEEKLNAMSKLMIGHMDELLMQARQDGIRLGKIEAAAALNAERSRADISALGGRVEEMFHKYAADVGEKIQAENAKSAREIMEFSRLSAYSLAGAASLSANMDELKGRLDKLRDNVKVFVDGLENVKLESVLGVSGALVRKNFEGIKDSLAGMEKELAFFEKMKGEVTDNLKDMARKAEGSGGHRK